MSKRRINFNYECGFPEIEPHSAPDNVPFSGFGVLVDHEDLIQREQHAYRELEKARKALHAALDPSWWNHLLPLPGEHERGQGMTRTILLHPQLRIQCDTAGKRAADRVLRQLAETVDEGFHWQVVQEVHMLAREYLGLEDE